VPARHFARSSLLSIPLARRHSLFLHCISEAQVLRVFFFFFIHLRASWGTSPYVAHIHFILPLVLVSAILLLLPLNIRPVLRVCSAVPYLTLLPVGTLSLQVHGSIILT
jgi:hypothetical protein